MFRFILLLVVTFVSSGSGAVLAADAPAAAAVNLPPLTLGRAVERALEHNAGLRAFGAERAAEVARGDAVSLPPQYRIGVELENVAGSGAMSGLDSLESTLNLFGVFELGGKQQGRRDLAALRLEVLDTEQHIRRLDVAAAVARRFVDVVASAARTTLSGDNTMIATRTVDAVRARLDAARASRADLAKADIGLIRARLEQQRAERETRVARVALAGLLGVASPDFGDVSADLYRIPAYQPFVSFAARVEQNPELILFASRLRLQDARGRLAETARHADLGWSAGIRRLEGPGDQAFVVGIELPLGNAKRTEPLRREVAAEQNRLHFETGARRLELRTTLYSAYEQLEQARAELDTLRGQSMPLAEDALRLTEVGYGSGRHSLLELTDAHSQLLNVRAQSIEAAADFHRLLIEIQRLTNEAVVDPFSGE